MPSSSLFLLLLLALSRPAAAQPAPSSALTEWRSASATYYAAADPRDTVGGACGYGDLGKSACILGGACGYGDLGKSGYGMATVGLSEALYEKGQACGGCYEVRCVDEVKYCFPGTTIIVTATNYCAPNFGLPADAGGVCNPPNHHFVLSIAAFEKIAIWKAGVIPVQYRRIKCIREGGVRFTIDGRKFFYTVLISNVAGAGDVTAVKIKGSMTGWLPMGRNWGQNWHISADLKGQALSFELTTSDSVTLSSYNVAPRDWTFGKTYVGKAENLPTEDLSDVYLLDFVGPSGFVAEISSKVESVTVLDHHKTAFESLSGNASVGKNVTKVIDMKRSGATIAYDYFKEKLLGNAVALNCHGTVDTVGVGVKFVSDTDRERVNRLFNFIEDADLWRWALPFSNAFSSGLKDMNIEYDINVNSALFDQLLALDPDLIIAHGQDTLLRKQELIDSVLEQSYEISLGSGRFGCCLAVDADSVSNLRSELGHQLAYKSRNLKLRGIGAVVYKVPELNSDQILKISLRSLGSEDTTPISQEYGGGGHQTASSFMLSVEEFQLWKGGTESQC